MNWFEITLIGILCFELGWVLSWYTFDRVFYEPQRKILDEALKHWGECLKVLGMVRDSFLPNKEGSMVSPIQRDTLNGN